MHPELSDDLQHIAFKGAQIIWINKPVSAPWIKHELGLLSLVLKDAKAYHYFLRKRDAQ